MFLAIWHSAIVLQFIHPPYRQGEVRMKTLKIRCVGISPLMMDPMSEAQLKAIITKVPLQVARDRPFEDVAAEKIYRDSLSLPSSVNLGHSDQERVIGILKEAILKN